QGGDGLPAGLAHAIPYIVAPVAREGRRRDDIPRQHARGNILNRAGPLRTIRAMRLLRSFALALLVVLLTAPAALAQDVTLSVAISLKDAVEELGRQFAAGRPGVTLRYNFGA